MRGFYLLDWARFRGLHFLGGATLSRRVTAELGSHRGKWWRSTSSSVLRGFRHAARAEKWRTSLLEVSETYSPR
jgi:hypothetical protein